ncbi:hypothetical protein FNU76_00665 [Chitinimonas arctica]|uniref:FimV N-terminal domain-containing protein n=1 Tax=Chitinimonas arctica TaxID=2594795 RepID=A0A516SA04_9NEIS|nr:hypothetical protein [Chitinimonas arctica]QDQ24976.1 hypothetical protein FNU76_00665 [Chitinimonas arctica]
MPRPFASLTQLSLALGFVGLSQAGSLDELQLQSGLGQFLEARVRIGANSGESIAADCLSASLRDSEGANARRLYIEFTPDRSGGWARLAGDAILNEPVLTLSVRLHCVDGSDIKRDYTLLLDPPINTVRTPAATLPQADRTARQLSPEAGDIAGETVSSQAGDSLYGMARERFPDRPDARRQFIAGMRALNPDLPADGEARLPPATTLSLPLAQPAPSDGLNGRGRSWTVQPGESFYAIVRRLYPDQPAEKKALVIAMRKLNPQLPRNGEKPLPPGMQLQLPEKLTAVPTMPSAQAATSAGKAIAPVTDRLQISAEPAAKGTPANPQDAIHERERLLLDQAAEQLAMLHEARNRIEKLDKRLNWLVEQLGRRDAERSQALKPTTDWGGLAVGATAGAGLAALLALLLHGNSSRRRNQANSAGAKLAASLGEDRETQLWKGLEPKETAPPPSRPIPPPRYDSPVQEPQASDMDVFILNSAASEAAVLAANGQYDRAIIMLQDEIEAYPTSLVNWMQLLELLYGNRDVDRYIEVASRFKTSFASEALWNKVRRMGIELAPNEALFKQEQSASIRESENEPEHSLNDILDAGIARRPPSRRNRSKWRRWSSSWSDRIPPSANRRSWTSSRFPRYGSQARASLPAASRSAISNALAS